MYGEEPEWLRRLPYSAEYFYGRGEGNTDEEAEESGKRDILIQLNSQVAAVVREEYSSAAGGEEVSEKVGAFMASARLRTAEVQARFESGGRRYALIKYHEDCGLLLAESALERYKEEHALDNKALLDQLDKGAMIRAARIERFLNQAVSGDYRSADLAVAARGSDLVVRVMNFAAYETELTDSQRRGLEALSRSLFEELEIIGYSAVKVEGYANPTGEAGEKTELAELSQARAETMAGFLRSAGVRVSGVRGHSAERLIGTPATAAGRSRNRRAEIIVAFD